MSQGSENIYKINIYCTVATLCLFLFSGGISAQNQPVLRSSAQYCRMVRQDSMQKMTELKTLIPSVIYDLRYATEDNFTGTKLYPSGKQTFLRKEPAEALRKIADELKSNGILIKVFDAYRPFHVTQKMWDLIGDENYVANPAKGSGHNRGISIDLTLTDLQENELPMGTGFDHFSDTAHHTFTGLPEQILANRKLLKETMEKYGFKALPTEWWHYSWPNNRDYRLLDLPCKKLMKTCY